MTNDDLENTTQKTEDWAIQTHLKAEVKSGDLGG